METVALETFTGVSGAPPSWASLPYTRNTIVCPTRNSFVISHPAPITGEVGVPVGPDPMMVSTYIEIGYCWPWIGVPTVTEKFAEAVSYTHLTLPTILRV